MSIHSRIFNPDNWFFTFMAKVADMMILNVLFLITSIPIVTIGASLTALDSVTLALAKKKETYLWKMYWSAWKANWKRSTVLFLISAAIGLFLAADLWITGSPMAAALPFAKYLRYFFMVLAFLWLCAMIYLFPLQAIFENTLGATLKNSILMAVSRFPYTVLMVLILAAPFAIGWFFPVTLPYVAFFFMLMGFAVISRFHATFLLKAFRPFLPEEDTEEHEESAEDTE